MEQSHQPHLQASNLCVRIETKELLRLQGIKKLFLESQLQSTVTLRAPHYYQDTPLNPSKNKSQTFD